MAGDAADAARPIAALHRDATHTMMRVMRTTIDLPEDLHRLLLSVAHDRRETLSQTAGSLLRRALMPEGNVTVQREPRTGLPVVSLGRVVTREDVRSLEDEG